MGDRGPEKTLCPSEVARALDAESWRDLMPRVGTAGLNLAESGDIVVMQRGRRVDPRQVKGPIRYRLNRESPPPR
ncbi:MAG: DUF3253 domain-containing protein [Leptolyngbyaceae cyanobacterium T60_A2020_046]|nr:DUF3253 domain-containing protein [Leptolyngbyaceae cyanobacterium T60_A2020_046]